MLHLKSQCCSITVIKLYVPVVTFSTENNAKLPEQLKSAFKRTINWNKYQPTISTERPNQYLDFLIDPGFQGRIDFLFYYLKIKHKEQVTNDITF